MRSSIHTTLPPPSKHANIPPDAYWLSGEGAGSWFHLVPKDDLFEVTRYSPEGGVECAGMFKPDKEGFSILHPYSFTHLSHCRQVRIVQGNNNYIFERK